MKKEIRELFCEISGAATKNLRIVNGLFLMLFIGAVSESFSVISARNTHYIVFVINTYILVLGYLCHYTIKNNKTEKILVIDVINYLLLVFYTAKLFWIYIIWNTILLIINYGNTQKLKF